MVEFCEQKKKHANTTTGAGKTAVRKTKWDKPIHKHVLCLLRILNSVKKETLDTALIA